MRDSTMATEQYKLVFSHLEMIVPKNLNKKVQKVLNTLDIQSYHATISKQPNTDSDEVMTLHIGGDDLTNLFNAMTHVSSLKCKNAS